MHMRLETYALIPYCALQLCNTITQNMPRTLMRCTSCATNAVCTCRPLEHRGATLERRHPERRLGWCRPQEIQRYTAGVDFVLGQVCF